MMNMFINENYESKRTDSQLDASQFRNQNENSQSQQVSSKRKFLSIESLDQNHISKQQGFFASFKDQKQPEYDDEYSGEKSSDQIQPSFLQNHKRRQISTNILKSQENEQPQISYLTSPDKDNTIDRILNDSDQGYLFKDNFLSKYTKKTQKTTEVRNKQIFNLQQWMGGISEPEAHELSINCTEIAINLFPKQSHSEIFTLTNTTSKKMMVKIQAIFPLIVISKKNAVMDYDLQLQSNYAKMVTLEGWQKKDIKLLLGKKYISASQNQLSQDIQDQCDIFETLVLQYILVDKQNEEKMNFIKITDKMPKKKIFIPISIYYCLPKLTLQFVGNTEVIKIPNTTIQQENIIQIKIKNNGVLQYPLDIAFKGIQHSYRHNTEQKFQGKNSTKLQLEIMTYGCIKAFPENITLFDNSTNRIMLRKKNSKTTNNQNNNTMNIGYDNSKGVVTIKAINCGILFVVGVVLL